MAVNSRGNQCLEQSFVIQSSPHIPEISRCDLLTVPLCSTLLVCQRKYRPAGMKGCRWRNINYTNYPSWKVRGTTKNFQFLGQKSDARSEPFSASVFAMENLMRAFGHDRTYCFPKFIVNEFDGLRFAFHG